MSELRDSTTPSVGIYFEHDPQKVPQFRMFTRPGSQPDTDIDPEREDDSFSEEPEYLGEYYFWSDLGPDIAKVLAVKQESTDSALSYNTIDPSELHDRMSRYLRSLVEQKADASIGITVYDTLQDFEVGSRVSDSRPVTRLYGTPKGLVQIILPSSTSATTPPDVFCVVPSQVEEHLGRIDWTERFTVNAQDPDFGSKTFKECLVEALTLKHGEELEAVHDALPSRATDLIKHLKTHGKPFSGITYSVQQHPTNHYSVRKAQDFAQLFDQSWSSC